MRTAPGPVNVATFINASPADSAFSLGLRPPERILAGEFCARMHPDVLWLFRLTLDQGLVSPAQADAVRTALGDRAELMDFAQKLIDDGIVDDVAALERLADLAFTQGKKGPPAHHPFEPAPDAGASGRNNAPFSFPFSSIAQLDEPALASALRELLRATARFGASDLHLSPGARPFVRKHRELSFIAEHVLTAAESLRLNTALLSAGQRKIFLERKDYDYALAVTRTDRYRVNLMFHKTGAAGAYRMIPDQVRTLADLGYEAHLDTLHRLLSYHNGLILITGPVGSGKTATLASMVAYLNETRTDHIITVEDPIEVVQPAKNCNVTQREIGPHTKSFATALKSALREDPDVIVIGELRDLETIEMAITASETGHLVIGTMHTSDASTTLNRLLDVFPPSQQTQIRVSVAESLRGVICQRLLPATDGGLTLACEIMVSNTAIQNLIREGKTQGLKNTMETGAKEGMCLMGNVVFNLWQQKKISSETALANISNRTVRARITG